MVGPASGREGGSLGGAGGEFGAGIGLLLRLAVDDHRMVSSGNAVSGPRGIAAA